jgi:hypothetical protein
MSIVELLRIAIPVAGLAILATLLVGFVRRRSAARERALTGLASRYGLEYSSGGTDLFQGSWPGKVNGSQRGRNVTIHYKDDPFTTQRGYHSANYSAVIEIAIQNRQQGSLSLTARHTGPLTGDLFDQAVAISSKPAAFAAQVLADPDLRQRLATALTGTNPGKINVVRTGTLAFVRNTVYRNSEDLAALVDLLGDLADVIESLPARADVNEGN